MAAELIAEEGILKGLILFLEKREAWTIGRDPDLCTIVLEDPKVSRLHMRIKKTEAGYYVENLSDSNPVLIDDIPVVAPTLLHADNMLTIGGSVFHFYPEGAPSDYSFTASFEEEDAFTQEHPLDDKQPAEEEIVEPEPEEKEEEIFEEDTHDEETLFEESEVPQLHIDLTQTTRFFIKVIAGPNTGAEFALDLDRSYLIGTDTASCDIIFNDLSVSREHAKLSVAKDGQITIQDLNSRNGVIVDKERIIGSRIVHANAVVALGTSAFLLIDREAPSETIATPLYETPLEEVEEKPKEEVKEEAPILVKAPAPKKRAPLPAGALLLSLIICSLAVLLGISMISLLQTKEVEVPQKDRVAELQAVMKKYPAIRFTYNQGTGKLFLMGHLRNGIEHNELVYQLQGLGFIASIDDNTVNDEAVWQEMNILLSKHPDFKGVSMHAPDPGVFVISGYLQTEKQASDLIDYLNVNFNYVNLLQNRVVVEQSIEEEVQSRLMQQGFAAVNANLSHGELQLTGYISSTSDFSFDNLLEEFKKIPGIRAVRNFVVTVTPEQGVVDLNKKYQPIVQPAHQGSKTALIPRSRYVVTGYSKHGDINVNVVINGRILSRGDCIDGYTITSIQPHAIFLEKDGLKYKIEYNKCNSIGIEE